MAQFTAALIIVMVLGSFDYKPALAALTFGVISHGPQSRSDAASYNYFV